MKLNQKKWKYIFRNESLPINNYIQSGSGNLPKCSPYRECLLHRKSIPVPLWPNGTHCHSNMQHPSGILGV